MRIADIKTIDDVENVINEMFKNSQLDGINKLLTSAIKEDPLLHAKALEETFSVMINGASSKPEMVLFGRCLRICADAVDAIEDPHYDDITEISTIADVRKYLIDAGGEPSSTEEIQQKQRIDNEISSYSDNSLAAFGAHYILSLYHEYKNNHEVAIRFRKCWKVCRDIFEANMEREHCNSSTKN